LNVTVVTSGESASHDVTLSGWRWADFLRALSDGNVAAVKTGPPRYANLHQGLPLAGEIKIEAIAKRL